MSLYVIKTQLNFTSNFLEQITPSLNISITMSWSISEILKLFKKLAVNIRCKNSQLHVEFLNLIINSCHFKQCFKHFWAFASLFMWRHLHTIRKSYLSSKINNNLAHTTSSTPMMLRNDGNYGLAVKISKNLCHLLWMQLLLQLVRFEPSEK